MAGNCREMGFTKKEYEFLAEIGVGPENLGGYVNGKWKASGPVISTVNPSNNQVFSLPIRSLKKVLVFKIAFFFFIETYGDRLEFWLVMILSFISYRFIVLWVIDLWASVSLRFSGLDCPHGNNYFNYLIITGSWLLFYYSSFV